MDLYMIEPLTDLEDDIANTWEVSTSNNKHSL